MLIKNDLYSNFIFRKKSIQNMYSYSNTTKSKTSENWRSKPIVEDPKIPMDVLDFRLCEKCLNANITINKNKCKKHKQLKAGGIILDNTKQFILLIKGNYAKKWNVPKGTSNDNESIRNTAIREIKEETGINIEISKYDIPVKIYKVFLYLTTININSNVNPIDKQEIQEIKWFSISELNQLEHKTTLLKKVINYLETAN